MQKQLPPEFEVTDEYNSHRPMLWMALEHVPGLVVEFGCGDGSTPVIYAYCALNPRWFWSFETNKEWSDKFPDMVFHIPAYHGIETTESIAILFIDSAPGEDRAYLLEEYRHKAAILIVHDTEPGAEPVYHIQDALNSFPHRCDLLVPGYAQTTAVSMEYDFKEWKGVTIGKYQFI